MPKRYYSYTEVLKIIDKAMDTYSKMREKPYYQGISGHLIAKAEVVRKIFTMDVEIIKGFYYKCGDKVDAIRDVFTYKK